MTTRHKAREIAFQFLFRNVIERQGQGAGATTAPLTGAALLREIDSHFEHFDVPADAREFSAQLIAQTIQYESQLDELIEKHAANWKMSRMGLVDKSILRLAVGELQHAPETAPAVVIDEAVELAKQFGTEETPGFVNGILDSVRRTLGR